MSSILVCCWQHVNQQGILDPGLLLAVCKPAGYPYSWFAVGSMWTSRVSLILISRWQHVNQKGIPNPHLLLAACDSANNGLVSIPRWTLPQQWNFTPDLAFRLGPLSKPPMALGIHESVRAWDSDMEALTSLEDRIADQWPWVPSLRWGSSTSELLTTDLENWGFPTLKKPGCWPMTMSTLLKMLVY